MAVIALRGERRDGLGKGGARKARAAGHIPGVVYGHGDTPMAVQVASREFEIAMRKHEGGNAIVNLAVNGGEVTALIRAVQYDPITHNVLHLDFQHISLTEEVEVEVSVHLTGTAVGVKDGGGILETILRQVKVRCLPTAIPPHIDLDVSALNVGDSLHVRDISAAGITILSDPDAPVAAVVAPTVEEAPAAATPVEGAAAAEPEVIAKGKKEEEGEGEAKDAAPKAKEKK
jgi:large subunit ribosomal protein L25